jgi:hypothetical protein
LIFHSYFQTIPVADWQHAQTKFGDNLRLPLTQKNAGRMCQLARVFCRHPIQLRRPVGTIAGGTVIMVI